MTRIRQVAPLLHIINFNNLYFHVENETILICAKNRVDLSSISEVSSYITEWPRFFGPPCTYVRFYNPGPKFWGSLPQKILWAKNMQNLARFRSTSKFDGEYLQKE